jgi:hypothetical protein
VGAYELARAVKGVVFARGFGFHGGFLHEPSRVFST